MTCLMHFTSKRAKRRVGCACGRKCRREIVFLGVRLAACQYHLPRAVRELRRRGVAYEVRWCWRDRERKGKRGALPKF